MPREKPLSPKATSLFSHYVCKLVSMGLKMFCPGNKVKHVTISAPGKLLTAPWPKERLAYFKSLIRNLSGVFPAGERCAQCRALSRGVLCEGSGSVRATWGLSAEHDRTLFPPCDSQRLEL